MSRQIPELRIYEHQRLMDEFNDLQIRIKAHLFDVGSLEFKQRHPKPTVQELDQMMSRVFEVLKCDSKPMKNSTDKKVKKCIG